jgi:hypothetical protein
LSFLFPSPPETVFRFASASQDLNVLSSRLDATCFAGALNGQSLACSAFDGTRTRFISLDPGSQQVSRLGWIEGRYTSAARPSNGWLSGWRNTTPVALHLQRRIAVHVDSSGGFQAFALAGADDLIGVMSYNGRSSKIRLIRLSSIESTSARAVE